MNDPTNCSEKCPLGTYYDTTVTFHAWLSIHFCAFYWMMLWLPKNLRRLDVCESSVTMIKWMAAFLKHQSLLCS